MEQILSHIWEIIGLLFGGSLILQITPIKINPWDFALKHVKEFLNGNIETTLVDVAKQVNRLEVQVATSDQIRREDKALDARRRILRFADECIRGEKHSEEYFNDILDDITMYTNHCDRNPGFKNAKCALSIEIIENAYRHCVEENDFLQRK